ncbi:NitT/TauT family transport system substrate-binding protein [Azospirillum fermentarium]|uniref:ABC transporter substrate-binding protein n=1 Tax=Azospirillum fermentarium TaxID=1233114 RepID=UPI0022270F7D|nr:ABC transporter substrate-binding protein [Azospirillum fermentarium]MCW2246295.1 NitT/TauT family transport system substrate-binding protein [Azospirillum fermentarium]
MNRKRWFGTAAVALALAVSAGAAVAVSAGAAEAKDKLTLQLKWVPQAQFAGYYVAKAKGFYDEAGLDVTIKAGGPDINPSQVIAGGGADVVVDWMPSALATREKGVPLVNFGQIFQKSGMLLTCRKDAGITAPKDFKGRTLGVWFAGNEYPFLAWMSKLGYSTSGPNPDIKILKQGFNVDPLLQKQADCISTEVYNEYQQVLEAGIPESELVVFNYQNEGVATLEDGFWALDKTLADPAKVDQFARLMKATFKGWDYAAKNQKEAVQIVLDNDATGSQTEEHQASMLRESVKLLEGATKGPGYLDPADYERTIGILLSGSSAPVISKKPEGAYTHAVYEAMEKLK